MPLVPSRGQSQEPSNDGLASGDNNAAASEMGQW